MRRGRKIVGAAALLLALLAGGLVWLVGTASGLRVLLSWGGGLLPGALSVDSVRGTVRGPLELRGLVYATETLEVRVARVAFDWHLRHLLRKRMDLLWLEASGVVVTPLGEDAPSAESPLVDVDLGWDLMVRRAEVSDVRILQRDASPLVLDRVALRGRTRGDTFLVDALTARGPEFALDVSGSLTPIGAYPLALSVRWELAERGDLPRLAARGTLSGTVEDLVVEQTLTAPHPAQLHGVLRDLFTGMTLEGRVETIGLPSSLLGEDLPAAALSGSVRAQGTLEALAGTAELHLDTEDYGLLRADGPWELQNDRFTLGPLAVADDAGRLHARLEGEVRTDTPARFDLRASWSDAAWPLEGELTVTSAGGSARLQGTSEAWSLAYDGEVRVPEVLAGRLVLRGEAREGAFSVTSARLGTLGGTVRGRGTVRWDPGVAWDLAVEGRGLDPEGLLAGLSGRLDLEGRVAGRLEGDTPVGSVSPLTFRGALRGAALAGRAEAVRHAGERISVEGLRADWGGATLSAEGTVSEPIDLHVAAAVPALAPLLPGASGSTTASLRLTGPYAAPRIEGGGEARDLSYGTLAVATLGWEGRAGLQPKDPLDLSIVAGEVRVGTAAFDRVALRTTGTGAEHRARLAVVDDAISLEAAARGALAQGPAWSGTLEDLSWVAPETGRWSLARPVALAASPGGFSLADACLTSRGSRLCVSGTWSEASGGEANAQLQELPLALLGPWFPQAPPLRGTLAGSMEARLPAAGPVTGTVRITLGAGMVGSAEGEEAPLLRFDGGRLQLAATPGGVTGEAAVALEGGLIEAEIRLPVPIRIPLEPAAVPLDLSLTASLPTLQPFSAVLPQIGALTGDLRANLHVGGTLASPRLDGEGRLSVASAEIPFLGLTLREGSLTARPAGEGRLDLTGRVRSGPGSLEIAGTAGPGASLRMHVGGERFLASDTEEAHALISPDLDLAYEDGRLRVTGEVRVPEATVVQEDGTAEMVVPVSPDVVVVGRQAPAGSDEAGLQVEARLRVILGDEVRYEGSGIEARVTGSVLVEESPGLPTRATGEITIVEGSYSAYGQELTIERGRLFYAGGPLTDPGIDLRAFRRANDGVVAGVEVEGSLSRPEVSLWSNPTLSETDQLSYLVLGRPASSATASDQSLLTRAAGALGVRGGNLLVGGLGERLGLEEAGIETGEGGYRAASLVLGTYLSPRLYVAYGVGLFEPTTLYRVRYVLDEHWTLQAETGTGTSAEIEYSIESGPGGSRPAPTGRRDLLRPRPGEDRP